MKLFKIIMLKKIHLKTKTALQNTLKTPTWYKF